MKRCPKAKKLIIHQSGPRCHLQGTRIINKDIKKMPPQELAPTDTSGLKSQGVIENTRPGGHWGYRQGTFIADQTKPARTVTGSTAQDWIRLNDGTLRRLTFLEVKRLQGFPEPWTFCGSKAQQFKQVGNAVPSFFGEVLGQTLIKYLETYNPNLKPQPLPERFEQYISYTKKDKKEAAINGMVRKRKL